MRSISTVLPTWDARKRDALAGQGGKECWHGSNQQESGASECSSNVGEDVSQEQAGNRENHRQPSPRRWLPIGASVQSAVGSLQSPENHKCHGDVPDRLNRDHRGDHCGRRGRIRLVEAVRDEPKQPKRG